MNDELKLGSAILACCCFMWFYAIPNHIKGPQAALYPKSLIIAMAMISLMILIKGIRSRKNGGQEEKWTLLNEASVKALLVVPIMAVYIFLIDIVGFYTITFVFIILFMLCFGARRPLSICLYSALLPAIIYLVIGKLLSFPFPAGILF